jgi:hypothetical protein
MTNTTPITDPTPAPEITPEQELEAARIVIRAAIVTFQGYAAEAAARREAEATAEAA